MGPRDDEIFGVVLASAARSFYSKSLEAMGTPANPELAEHERPPRPRPPGHRAVRLMTSSATITRWIWFVPS